MEKPSAGFQKVEELLCVSPAKAKSKVTASALREAALRPLPPTKQTENQGVGFFESGLLTGAGIYMSMILPALGFATYYLGKKGVEYISKLRH